MKYTTVTDLKYANASGSMINCQVNFENLGATPFTASANDLGHSAEIYSRATSGEFGVIQAYDSTEDNLSTTTQNEVQRQRRNALLVNLDLAISNPLRWASFSPETQTEYAIYRQALLDVPQQTGFPDNIEWPSVPNGYTEPVLVENFKYQI